MFKKICLSLIITSAISAFLFAGVYIENIVARSENGNITIEWKTQDESSLVRFEIERKSGNSDSYSYVISIDPKGNNSEYSYIDRTAYKAADAVYSYRLKIVDKNSSVYYSKEVAVIHKVSSVKSTWGSIKSMFR